MCNAWCIDFARAASKRLPRSIEVLEVGSRDVNGSVRLVFEPDCKSYLGVDREAGAGVDRVASVYELDHVLEGALYDLVVSTEMLGTAPIGARRPSRCCEGCVGGHLC
jgi:hypothetical protein